MAKRKLIKKKKLMRGRGLGTPDLMGQLQRIQEEMLKVQEGLGEETVEATAGGGVVKVVMDGHLRMRSISIAPEVVDPEDVEMLQDLVMAAVNEAIDKAQALAAEKMSSVVGGVSIPGLTL